MHDVVQYSALSMSNVTEGVSRGRSPTPSVVFALRARGRSMKLAARSGVSRRLVVQIEQGEANPSIGTLLRLAGAFEVTLTDLVGDQQTTTSACLLRPTRPSCGRGRPAAAHCSR